MQPPNDPEIPPPAALLRLWWAARHLGLSARSLGDARWRAKHGIPCLHIGRTLVFDVGELDRWLADARHRRGPIGRPRARAAGDWTWPKPQRRRRQSSLPRIGGTGASAPAGWPWGAEAASGDDSDGGPEALRRELARIEHKLAMAYGRQPTREERRHAEAAAYQVDWSGGEFLSVYEQELDAAMGAGNAAQA